MNPFKRNKTQEETVKFLRDKHDIHICVFPVYEKKVILKWYRVYITNKDGCLWNPKQKELDEKYTAYEKAVEVAITEANKILKKQ